MQCKGLPKGVIDFYCTFLANLNFQDQQGCAPTNSLITDMKEEEIELRDVKGEDADEGTEEPGEESRFLGNGVEERPGKGNGVEESPGKDVSCQDQEMPIWRLPR